MVEISDMSVVNALWPFDSYSLPSSRRGFLPIYCMFALYFSHEEAAVIGLCDISRKSRCLSVQHIEEIEGSWIHMLRITYCMDDGFVNEIKQFVGKTPIVNMFCSSYRIKAVVGRSIYCLFRFNAPRSCMRLVEQTH